MGCGTSVDVKEFKYQRAAHLSFRKSTSHVSDTPSPTCSPWTYSVYTTTTDGGSLTSESWPSEGLQVVSVTTLEGHSEPQTVRQQKKKILLQRQSRTGRTFEKAGVIRKTRSDETGSDIIPSQQTDTPSASQSYPVIPGTIEQSRPRRGKLTLEYNRDIFTHLKCKEENSTVDRGIRHCTVSMEEAVRGYNVTMDPPIRSQVLPPDDNKSCRLRGLFTAEGSLIRGSIGLNYSPTSIDDSTASEEMDDFEEIAEGQFLQPVMADCVTTNKVDDTDQPTLDCQDSQVELRTKQKPCNVSQSLDDVIQEDGDLVDRDQDDNMSVVAEGFETPSVLSLLDHVDHGSASDKSDADDDMSELTSLHSVSSHSSLGDMDNWIEEGYYPMAECDPSGIERPLIDDRSSSPPHVISKLLQSKTLSKAKTTSSNPAIAQPNNFVNLLKLPESSHKLGLGDHKFRSSTFYHPTTSSLTLQPPFYTDMSDNSNNCGTARPASAVICRGGSSDGAISMVSGDNNDSCEEMTNCSDIHLHENFFNDFGDNFDDEDFRRL